MLYNMCLLLLIAYMAVCISVNHVMNIWPLHWSTELNLIYFGEAEKNSIIALPGRSGYRKLISSNCVSDLERVMRSFIVMIQRGYGKLVDILIGCECVLATQSCLTLYDSMDCSPEFLCAWDSPGKSAGVGCISFWLVGGEVNGSQHHQPSGFHVNKSVVYCVLITHN